MIVPTSRLQPQINYLMIKYQHFWMQEYVSPPEAFWLLSEFPLHERSHTIIRLPVHLPEQQPVYFEQGKHKEALQRASIQETMLTAWFTLNRKSP